VQAPPLQLKIKIMKLRRHVINYCSLQGTIHIYTCVLVVQNHSSVAIKIYVDGRHFYIFTLKEQVVDQSGSVYAVLVQILFFADGVAASVEMDVPSRLFKTITNLFTVATYVE
jgi:hypothetical protein